jgi:hypothetical protein
MPSPPDLTALQKVRFPAAPGYGGVRLSAALLKVCNMLNTNFFFAVI